MPKTSSRPPFSLRTKLVAMSVLLALVVTVFIAAVSIAVLERSLMGRIDAQLASAFNRGVLVLGGERAEGDRSRSIEERFEDRFDDDIPNRQHRSDEVIEARQILGGPGQAPGTVALVLDADVLTAGLLTETGQIVSVSPEQLEELTDVIPDGAPHTLDLEDELGTYRVQGAIVDQSAVIVGLPLRDINQTVSTLSGILATVTVLGLVGLGVLASLLIRRTLRPLEQVASAADTVAHLELERGAVNDFERIKIDRVDARTEVGRVMTAVNAMMSNVESALQTREQSEQRVRSFVADASHELRTPLASIRGYSELVRRMGGELPEDVLTALGRIESESVRMTALVEELLLLARLDEGESVQYARCDLAELAREAVRDARVSMPNHEWSVEGADDTLIVEADRNALHRVLANLLTNAGMHTPPETAVSLSLRQDGDQVVVDVRDTGPGIPPELKDRLFDRFVRGDASRTRVDGQGGSGLGLSIVAALMDAHGGSVTVTSEPGNTVFRLRLPVSRPQSQLRSGDPVT